MKHDTERLDFDDFLSFRFSRSFTGQCIFLYAIGLETNYFLNKITIFTCMQGRPLRASPTHNIILVSNSHHFSIILTLQFFESPTTTPNITPKRIFFIIILLIKILLVLINTNYYINILCSEILY